MSFASPLRPASFLWPVLLLLGACRDDDIVAYRIPKSQDPAPSVTAAAGSPHGPAVAAPVAAAPGAAMAGTTVATATGAALTWTAPSRWQPKPGSAMRKGSYVVAGTGSAPADLAITAFPGDVGGEAANVNRWRGQMGLAPLADAQLADAIVRLETNGLKIAVVDVSGSANSAASRLIGAMVPFGGATWFFKLVGPDALVASEKTAFVEFLKTVRPTEATP